MNNDSRRRLLVLRRPAMMALHRLTVIAAVICAHQVVAASQASTPASDRELYAAACATCHGPDGRGAPVSRVGFDTPIPDFTDCAFATPEPDADWMAVVHDGGPARGFNRRMPAFGSAMGEKDLRRLVRYVRGFCASSAWPRGELNLPRALVTEKAFPENEAVVTTTIDRSRPGSVSHEILYERRVGARSQFEIAVPFLMQSANAGGSTRGLGDAAVAVKHALFHNVETGRIVSVAGELVLPTGQESVGLGVGTTVFEPFLAYGQMLPRDGFVQLQAGLELPASRKHAEREAFWRAALGRTFVQGRFGRAWSPMVELLAARELESGARSQWDVVPQLQVTLNRRQHLMVSAGVRIPLNAREERHAQVMTYFLWDWFDGALWDGW